METDLAFLGLLIKVEFRTQFLMLILAAALAAAGTDWLIQGHPHKSSTRLDVENWVIPAMAAVAIGVIVIRIPGGLALWIGLLLGATLLVAVLIAEFIVYDPQDPRYGHIATVLNGLALLLLLASILTIQVLELRTLFAIPLIFIACLIVTWRLFKLTFPENRVWTWAFLVSFIVSQIALGLHYWPIPPLRSGFLLGLVAYLAYQWINLHLHEEDNNPSHLVEIAIVCGISLLAIFLLT
jgi:hypothetical protein